MLLGLVLRRMLREWRVMGVLLLSLCLVTAFLALAPMFVRTVASADAETRLENLTSREARIDLTDDERFDAGATQTILRDALGDKLDTVQHYAMAGNLLCGLNVTDGGVNVADREAIPRYISCHRPYAYDDVSALFEIVRGRMPEMRDDGVDDGVIEVVIHADIVEKSMVLDRDFALEIGATLRGGVLTQGQTDASQSLTQAALDTFVTYEIVGIVDTKIPASDPFWDGQPEIFGATVVGDPVAPDELYFGMVMLPEAFDTQIAPNVPDVDYVWRIGLDVGALSVEDLQTFEADLSAMRSALIGDHPLLQINAGLVSLVERFEATIAMTEQPVILLAFIVMVLMIYNLITTVSLIFEQQSREWAMMASRGGSTRQLVWVQFLTVSILALIAFIVGPLLALITLYVLAAVGPQAEIIAPQHIGAIPLQAYGLSAVAALIAVIALTLPAVPMAQGSFLRLKQNVSRPPLQPRWARYFLDVVMLLLGLAFTARLYLLVGGEVGASQGGASSSGATFADLLGNPGLLARLIAEADGAVNLSDPFNLAGPVLLIAGLALLWIRLFPYVVGLIGLILQALNALTVRLALWSVEREPGHYAQLVLLLIGTLALGTASLSLTRTREVAAWESARATVGADVRLTADLDALYTRGDFVRLMDSMAGVDAWMPVYYARSPVTMTDLFGVSANVMTAMYPEYSEAVELLTSAEPAQFAGAYLPDDVRGFAVDVYVEPDVDDGDVTTTTEVIVHALNPQQQQVYFALQSEMGSSPPEAEWVTYTGAYPTLENTSEWRLIGLALSSRRSEAARFDDHVVRLDNFRVIDSTGVSHVIESWEPDTIEEWDRSAVNTLGRSVLSLTPEDDLATDGAFSLRVAYAASSTIASSALIDYRPVETVIPVLISPSFALRYGTRQALDVGDVTTSRFDISVGGNDRGDVFLTYRVAGIVESFPSAGDSFAVGLLEDMAYALNRGASGDPLRQVEYWVMLDERQPPPIFRAVVGSTSGVFDVRYAWDLFTEIQRDPLSNAVSGMLFAGFWVSLGLILIDFAFYLMVIMRRRAVSFAVLRSMGWESGRIWRMLTVEQATFIMPALVIGVLLGTLIAYIILPFLSSIGVNQLTIPVPELALMLGGLVLVFMLLLALITGQLRRVVTADVMRFGE